MRTRGKIYWDWVDPVLHSRSADKRLADGILLNVQVRTSAEGETQLFLGVYGAQGMMLFEQAFNNRPGQTMTQAMTWVLARAKQLAVSRESTDQAPPKTERVPRKGSRQSRS